MLSGVRNGAFSLRLHIALKYLLLCARREDRLLDLTFFDTFVFEYLIQTRDQALVLVIRHERMREFYPVLGENLVHIVGDNLRIRRHDRTVIVVLRVLGLQLLIIDARIKDPLFAHLHQSLDMPMHQLGRIAGRIGGDRIHALLVKLLRRHRRKDYAVAQLRKERKPERIILIQVQYPRQSHMPTRRRRLCKWLIAKQSL